MADILEEVLKLLPDREKISDSVFEGANIVLYTKNKDFFLNTNGAIIKVVDALKKRVELRPDPSITMDVEKAEETIRKMIPAEAGIANVIFDIQRSMVIIEVEKPGVAIGKQGELLKEIKTKTFWVPLIRRTPALRSKLIENIRYVLYENNDFRRKFLNKIGKRVYGGWTKEKRNEWIRLTFLGGAREVGRSCILLQTPESRILLDCGLNVAANTDERAYPMFDAPEFILKDIDAIILTHSHLDHCALIPALYKMGYDGPLYCTSPTRDISALLMLDYIGIAQKEGLKPLYSSSDIKDMVKHTICLDYEEVTDVTPDVRLTLYNAGHTLGSAMAHMHIGNGLHNFLYSLDWKTPVTLIDKENNVCFEPIGKIADDMFKKYPHLTNKKGIAEEVLNLEGYKTVAFSPSTYKSEVVEITSFIRHPTNEELYEIRTASGRKAVVTASHSVFTAYEGSVKSVRVNELRKDDFIIGIKKLYSDITPKMDLFSHMGKLRLFINDYEKLNGILAYYKEKVKTLPEKDAEAFEWVKDHFKYAMYKNDIAKEHHIHPRRVRRVFKHLGIKDHPRVKHAFPSNLEITPEFARFIGYLISEGSCRKNSQTITITNFNHKILEDAYNIIKKVFGIKGDLRYKDNVVLFNSKQLKYLVLEVLKCGKNAYEKRAPPNILLSNKEIITNFLYGYFSGDGGVRVRERGREITANTKSEKLIQDIAFMLLHLGIVPTITYNKHTKMHVATINDSVSLSKFLEEIGINHKKEAVLACELETRKRKAGFAQRIPCLLLSKKGQFSLSKTQWKSAKSCGIPCLKDEWLDNKDKKLVESDLMFDQITSIKKIKPSDKNVYDFKVAGYENFLGGEGFLFLHNTGDMNYETSNLLTAASTRFPRLETVLIEATYGGKDDIVPSRKDSEKYLLDVITDTVKNQGRVLMPVLGVGRSQEVMLIIERAIREGLIDKIPIYVQGMVWDVTAIHTTYPDFFNNKVKRNIFHKDHNPFLSDVFKQVAGYNEMQEVLEEKGPCVIMATSGMMVGGPSVEYFKVLAENPKNALVFTCYQGEGSLGRRIQQGEKIINFPKGEKVEEIKVNMAVHTISGFSGHSSRKQLMQFVYNLDPKPKRIIVNHGESSKCLDLASSLHKMHRIETNAPKNLEAVRIR